MDINQNELRADLNLPQSVKAKAKVNDYVNSKTYIESVASMGQKAKRRIENYRRAIRVLDLQQAVSRYEWKGLPNGMNGELLERMLYFRGVVAIWKDAEENYQILPVAMTSIDKDNIDFYGRWKYVKPMPFNGKSDLENLQYLGLVTRQAVWSENGIDYSGTKITPELAAVVLFDYTPQLSMSILSRSILQEAFIDSQAEILTLERSALIQKSLPYMLRIDNQSMLAAMQNEIDGVEYATFNGKWAIGFQDRIEGVDLKNQMRDRNIEDYWRAYESRNRLRQELLGINNGGTFMKAAHLLQSEQEENAAASEKVLIDGLYQRKLWCKLVNAMFKDLTISVDICKDIIKGGDNGNNSKITRGISNSEI